MKVISRAKKAAKKKEEGRLKPALKRRIKKRKVKALPKL